MIIGDVKNELNDPLLEIVKVVPLTSFKPYFPLLSNFDDFQKLFNYFAGRDEQFLVAPAHLFTDEVVYIPDRGPIIDPLQKKY